MSKKLFTILFLAILAVAIPSAVFASSTDGTIDSSYKYAWSNNSGWLNFGLTSGNVHITDTALTGYIWSANYGWIILDPASNGGVFNDGEGNLSGYAWGEQLGWINFSGVTISATGTFHGAATGTLVGVVTFDCNYCDVRTDWRPASTRGGTCGNGIIETGEACDAGSDNGSCPQTCSATCNINSCSSGGGGGSSWPAPITTIISSTTTSTVPTIPPVCTECLTKYIKYGANNDPVEVTKLQNYLRTHEGFVNLKSTGVYDKATFDAVKKFQTRYVKDVLSPWHIDEATGNVLSTTIDAINTRIKQGIYAQIEAEILEQQNASTTANWRDGLKNKNNPSVSPQKAANKATKSIGFFGTLWNWFKEGLKYIWDLIRK